MKIDEHETRLQELEWEKTKVMEIKTAKEESVKVCSILLKLLACLATYFLYLFEVKFSVYVLY